MQALLFMDCLLHSVHAISAFAGSVCLPLVCVVRHNKHGQHQHNSDKVPGMHRKAKFVKSQQGGDREVHHI